MELNTKKKRRKFYKLKDKKKIRTKLINQVRFFKVMNKVHGKTGDVLLLKKYYPIKKNESVPWLNCMTCKYNKGQTSDNCPLLKTIGVWLEDAEMNNRRKLCLNHKFVGHLTSRKKRDIIIT